MIPKVKDIQQSKQTGSSAPEKKKSDTEATTSTGKRGDPIQHRKSERIQASQSSSLSDIQQKMKKVKDAINKIPPPEDFSNSEMQENARIISQSITAPDFKRISLQSRVNHYLAIAYINTCMGKSEKAEKYIKQIAKLSDETVDQHIKVLNLYYTLSSCPLTEDHAEDIKELYNLTFITEFPPAIFWLISCSLDPVKNCFFSPYSISKLIEIAPTPFAMNNLTLSFSKCRKEMMDFQRAALLTPDANDREQVISLITQVILEKFVTTDRTRHITIPRQLFSFLYSGLLTCRRSLRVGSIDQPGRAEHLASTRLTSESKEKGISIMEGYIPTLSPYLQGVTELIIGLIKKYAFILGDISPISCAQYLERAAGRGSFPLLYKDAGELYMGVGHFEQAIKCYDKLLATPSLPGTTHKIVTEWRELCDLHSANSDSGAGGEEAAVQGASATPVEAPPQDKPSDTGESQALPSEMPPQTIKQAVRIRRERQLSTGSDTSPSSRKKRKKTKKTKKTEAKPSTLTMSTTPGDQQEASTSQKTTLKIPSDTQPGAISPQTTTLTPEFEAVSLATHPLLSAASSTPPKPTAEMETTEATGSIETPRVKPKTLKEMRHEEPMATSSQAGSLSGTADRLYPRGEGGWLSDSDSQIEAFCRKIRKHRKNCNLDEERDWIQSWLQTEGKHYGRICEEVGWFYIRQLGLPTEYRLLHDDHADTSSELLQCASDWVSKALANYLQVPITRNIGYLELKALIETYYKSHPEHRENPEFNKRLRAVCSSYAHIQERLFALSKGKSRHAHAERSHQLYQLKRVADPSYRASAPATVAPKLTYRP